MLYLAPHFGQPIGPQSTAILMIMFWALPRTWCSPSSTTASSAAPTAPTATVPIPWQGARNRHECHRQAADHVHRAASAARQWWIGFIITFVGSIAGTLLFNPDMLVSDEAVPPQWPDTFWQLAWLVPRTAITVKRFNDRDWPWWLGYAFGSVRCVSLRGAALRVADRP